MINIRKAKVSDYEVIFDLYKQLYEAESVFDDNLKKDYYETEEAKEKVLKAVRARKKTFLVAEENKKVVGLVDGYMIDSNHHIQKVAYLDHLCVYKNFRKKGIGKMLIDEFNKRMKEQGAKSVKLNAFRQNYPASSLYEKEGFKEYSVYYIKDI